MRTYRRVAVVACALLAAGATTVGCGGRDWQGENARLQSDLDEARRELEQAQQRLSQLEGRNRELEQMLASRGADMNSLQALLDAAREREAAQRARLEAMRAMARQFAALVAAGQLRVRIVRGNMVVELPENVLFDSGRARLRDAGQETLGRVAEVLARVPNRNFLVAGHTDNVPIGRGNRQFDSNWDLSAARGVSVVRYLIERGLPAERVAAAGYAETQPVSSNDDDQGRAQNRRIEIIVLPNLDELPDLSDLEGELAGGDGAS